MPSANNALALPAPEAASLADSYGDLIDRLLGFPANFGVFDRTGKCICRHGPTHEEELARQVKARMAHPGNTAQAVTLSDPGRESAAILCLQDSSGGTLGAVAIRLSDPRWRSMGSRPEAAIADRLQPILPLVAREFFTRTDVRADVMTERTQELEWLFSATARLGARTDEQQLQVLLKEAADHIGASFAGLLIPEKRIKLTSDESGRSILGSCFDQSALHLLAWVQRQARPLLVNTPPRTTTQLQPTRLLAVPVVRKAGSICGVLAFFNDLTGPEFSSRHAYMARHLGRQMATLVASQFDLATGLYTRASLEQEFGKGCTEAGAQEGSVAYFDIDRLHLINETLGFEIGDEAIARVADLLSPPLVPEGGLTARVSGDRFAMVLRGCNTEKAVAIATSLQMAAAQIRIGPENAIVDLSLSCGVAALPEIPQALPRALAAAELACKTAKDRGRGRIELYATADSSMMRRQGDVLAVGRLRAALKEDRLVLYAQRIEPLQGAARTGGYEILLRMRDEQGTIIPPAEFISAAQRYQLLPAIDRWIVDHSLQELRPFAGLLHNLELSMSINISGQSVADSTFMQRFAAQIAGSGIAPATITIEITEQTAVGNVARAIEMVRRLRQIGCRLALDDFGTGVNSLTYLKGFPVTRVKIDGSFIRDLLTDRKSEETVKAIVQLARGMQIDTVAEFVENDELLHKVRKMGIDYAQGYAIAKPEPLTAMLHRLATQETSQPHRFQFDL